jgi:hypothetical protein
MRWFERFGQSISVESSQFRPLTEAGQLLRVWIFHRQLVDASYRPRTMFVTSTRAGFTSKFAIRRRTDRFAQVRQLHRNLFGSETGNERQLLNGTDPLPLAECSDTGEQLISDDRRLACLSVMSAGALSGMLHPDSEGAEELTVDITIVAISGVGRAKEGKDDLSRLDLEGKRNVVFGGVSESYLLAGGNGSLCVETQTANAESLQKCGVSRDPGDRTIGSKWDAFRTQAVTLAVYRKVSSFGSITVTRPDSTDLIYVFVVDNDFRQRLVKIPYRIEVIEKRLWHLVRQFIDVLIFCRSELPIRCLPGIHHMVNFRCWIAFLHKFRSNSVCGEPMEFPSHQENGLWCWPLRSLEKLRQRVWQNWVIGEGHERGFAPARLDSIDDRTNAPGV